MRTACEAISDQANYWANRSGKGMDRNEKHGAVHWSWILELDQHFDSGRRILRDVKLLNGKKYILERNINILERTHTRMHTRTLTSY